MSFYQTEAWKQSQAQANKEWGVMTCKIHNWTPGIQNKDGSVQCGFLGDNFNGPRCIIVLKQAKKTFEAPPLDNLEIYEPGADFSNDFMPEKDEFKPESKPSEGKVPNHGLERKERLGPNAYVKEDE